MATSIFTLSETYVQRVQNTWPSEGAGTNFALNSYPNSISNVSYIASGDNPNLVVNVYMLSTLSGYGITHNLSYAPTYYVTANAIGLPNITVVTSSNVATFTNLTKGNVYNFYAVVAYNNANSVPTVYNSNTLAAVRTVPSAPTIGTATIDSNTSANVSFTASTDNGANTIIRYTATSNPGGITANITQAGSGIITVRGLTENQSYTFTVTATNFIGTSSASSVSNSVLVRIFGSQAFTTSGTYSFIPTAGITSVSIVAVGGGSSGSKGSYPTNAPATNGGVGIGGYGGALGYKNNYPVTAGTPYTVVVGAGGVDTACTPYGAEGGDSYFSSPTIVKGGGAGFFKSPSFVGDGGGIGGAAGCGGYSPGPWWSGGSGGGAGGYAGAGGNGLGRVPTTAGNAGAGGGGGSGAYNNYPGNYVGCGAGIGSGGGGGVGIFGQGANGAGGSLIPGGTPIAYGLGGGGKGGSGGGDGGAGGSQYWNSPRLPPTGTGNYGGYGASALVPGANAQSGVGGGGTGGATSYDGGGGGGGAYGGGGAGGHWYTGKAGNGGVGAVRVVWPGTTRQFPTTCVST